MPDAQRWHFGSMADSSDVRAGDADPRVGPSNPAKSIIEMSSLTSPAHFDCSRGLFEYYTNMSKSVEYISFNVVNLVSNMV